MLKIKRSHDRLIFNIPVKDGLYIETGPWFSVLQILRANNKGHINALSYWFLWGESNLYVIGGIPSQIASDAGNLLMSWPHLVIHDNGLRPNTLEVKGWKIITCPTSISSLIMNSTDLGWESLNKILPLINFRRSLESPRQYSSMK